MKNHPIIEGITTCIHLNDDRAALFKVMKIIYYNLKVLVYILLPISAIAI
jgi:hypothetical protein